MASTAPGTDIQAKLITSAFIDNIFQDTWLLALAIKNIPGVVVDKALYQHCLDMIEDVQYRLQNAGAPESLFEEIKFAHCVFLDEAVNQVKVTTSCDVYGTTNYPIKEPLNMKEPASCPA